MYIHYHRRPYCAPQSESLVIEVESRFMVESTGYSASFGFGEEGVENGENI